MKSRATIATVREICESGGEDGETRVNKVVRGRETKCRSLQYGGGGGGGGRGGGGGIFLMILKSDDTHALRYIAAQCREAQCTTALTDMAQYTQINPLGQGQGEYGMVQCSTV